MEVANDLAKQVASLLRSGRIVDLSLTLDESLPCWWPSHVPYQQKTYSWFSDREDAAAPLRNRTGAAYQTRWLLLDEHTGTHCDAPCHFVPPADSGLAHAGELGSVAVDQLALDAMLGPAAVIDVTELAGEGRPGTSPRIEPRHVERHEAAHGRLREGDVVLLRSDWDTRYRRGEDGSAYSRDALVTASGPAWPSPSAATVDLLWERGVRCVGTDGVSIGGADHGEDAHLSGLTRGMVLIEALGALRQLPPRGSFFLFLPLKLAHGTGGPGRAIALIA